MFTKEALDIISINFWNILIALCNLLIMFFVLRKVFYNPVKKVMDERKNDIDKQYENARNTQKEADAAKTLWQEKCDNAENEAKKIIDAAKEKAQKQSDGIILDAKENADALIRSANASIEIERKKASADIKSEIADVSAAIAEKVLGREINEEDHKDLIDSFIDEIEADNDK